MTSTLRAYFLLSAAVAFALAVLVLTHCAPKMSIEDHAHTADEFMQELDCIHEYKDAGRATVDRCRSQVRAYFDSYWAHEFEAGAP
jgi:hypothetical protein